MEDGAPWGTWGVLGVVWWRCEHVCTAFVLGGGGQDVGKMGRPPGGSAVL